MERSARILVILAALVVVTAGLKAAQAFLLPVVAAGFVTIVALPIQARLRRWGVPKGLAIAATLVGALFTLAAFTTLLATALASFSADPDLHARVDERVRATAGWVRDLGWEDTAATFQDRFDPAALFDLVTAAMRGILDLLSSFVVILLLTVFALVEAEDLPAKMRVGPARAGADLSAYTHIADGVALYTFWKTVMNAVTGTLVGLLCWGLGVREPLLWGLIAFLFNFVPTVGSLIVAVPIVMLAWIDVGGGRALLVAVVYLAVNQLIGSVIEPRLMGRKMGLSPLVVLLSLLFWGWLWGPVGMLLSVPLTMILRTGLLQTRDGHTLGVLLGPRLDPEPPRS